jgi:Protein of unknown function (DUF3551)
MAGAALVAESHRNRDGAGQEGAMRLLLILLVAFIGAVEIGATAEAQNFPWCSNFADGWGGVNCGFATYEQCMATIRGSGGFCTQNNLDKQPAATAPARHTTRNRRSEKIPDRYPVAEVHDRM